MNVSSQDLPSWILSGPPLDEFTEFLRRVTDFFAASGVDVSSLVRGLVRAAYPEIADLTADLSVDSSSDPETEINDCYRQLRTLAASEGSAEYRATLARLRALQEEEARRLGAVFRANVGIDAAAFDAALRRADELLAIHEAPADHD